MSQQVVDQFRQALGRDPREDEVQYFQNFIDNGDLSPNDLVNILGASEEGQKRSLTSYGKQYEDALGASDSAILGKAGAALQGQFTRMGRPSSSGYGNAFGGAAQNLAMQRQSQLASFYGNGYQGIMGNTVSAGQGALNRGMGLRDERRNRAYALEDYYRQKNDYEASMKSQERRNLGPQLIKAGVQGAMSIAGAYAGGKGFAAGLGGDGSGATPSSSYNAGFQMPGMYGRTGLNPYAGRYP